MQATVAGGVGRRGRTASPLRPEASTSCVHQLCCRREGRGGGDSRTDAGGWIPPAPNIAASHPYHMCCFVVPLDGADGGTPIDSSATRPMLIPGALTGPLFSSAPGHRACVAQSWRSGTWKSSPSAYKATRAGLGSVDGMSMETLRRQYHPGDAIWYEPATRHPAL